MNFIAQPQTVWLLVGPSGCGKSSFAAELSIQLRAFFDSVHWLSSDKIRAELLGDADTDRMEPEMLGVSRQAFELLHLKLESLMSFPVLADQIIVDTTGLSDEFRTKVMEQVKRQHYAAQIVVFTYPDRAQYFQYCRNAFEKKLTEKGLKRLREEVLPVLGRHGVPVLRVKSPEVAFEGKFTLETTPYYGVSVRCRVERSERQNILVGDLHGSLKTFRKLLETLEVEMKGDEILSTRDKNLILLGDLIDKGPDSLGLVEFIHRNRQHFTLIQANHENSIVKRLTGEITEPFPPEALSYFDSFEAFRANETAGRQLIELYGQAVPFLRGPGFMATHAPCRVQVLGKMHPKAQAAQRNFRMEKRRRDFTDETLYRQYVHEQLGFLFKEAETSHPAHVFGHLMFRNFRYRNKYGIDQAACYGGKLTALTINPRGKPFVQQVESLEPKLETLDQEYIPMEQEAEPFSLSRLEPRVRRRILRSAEDKVQFISGTISPPPADVQRGVLEDIDSALDYYRNAKITRVVLQPKYMGSRANVYLDLVNPSQSRMTSRQGFPVDKRLDRELLETLYRETAEKLKDWAESSRATRALLDCELLPWSVLGRDLIEESFRAIGDAQLSELRWLGELGFEPQLKQVRETLLPEYQEIRNILAKKQQAEKLGQARLSTATEVAGLRFNPIAEQSERARKYRNQVELYGYEGKVELKPFGLLKWWDQDGQEHVCNDSPYLQFIELSESTDRQLCLVVSLVSDDVEHQAEYLAEQYQAAREHFQALVRIGLEGVVVKPYMALSELPGWVAPHLKVRNPEYLRIIYGYEYDAPEIYAKHLSRKKVNGKIRESIQEFRDAQKLLRIPENQINPDNRQYLESLHRLIQSEERVRQLDPRL